MENEDDLVRYKKPAKRDRKPKGCPENNGNEHVYDWVNQFGPYRLTVHQEIAAGKRYYYHSRYLCLGCLGLGRDPVTKKSYRTVYSNDTSLNPFKP